MADQAFKFNSYFKLYNPEGLQISFSVSENEAEAHLQQLDVLLNTLYSQKYRQNPEGVTSGERLQEVDGWVLGRTSEDQPCVHLYKSPLQFKVATVWKEDLDKLPINLQASTTPAAVGSAPEREAAIKFRMMNECNFKIILVQEKDFNGNVKLTEKGNPRMRFNRTYGYTPEGEKVETTTQTGFVDVLEMVGPEAQKFIKWGRGLQFPTKGKSVQASPQDYGTMVDLLEQTLGDKEKSLEVLQVVTGLQDIKKLSSTDKKIVQCLLDWVPTHISVMGVEQENPKHKEAYVKALEEIQRAVQNR